MNTKNKPVSTNYGQVIAKNNHLLIEDTYGRIYITEDFEAKPGSVVAFKTLKHKAIEVKLLKPAA